MVTGIIKCKVPGVSKWKAFPWERDKSKQREDKVEIRAAGRSQSM